MKATSYLFILAPLTLAQSAVIGTSNPLAPSTSSVPLAVPLAGSVASGVAPLTPAALPNTGTLPLTSPLVSGSPAAGSAGVGDTATPGTTTPGATTPGTTIPGITTPGTTPGIMTPGITTPGITTPGTTAPETTIPGTTTPGTATPGITTPGTTAPGTTAPGTTTPETTTPGTTTPETTTPGTTTPGTTAPGTTAPGTTAPGTTAPGTTTPGTTTPGTTTPGTPVDVAPAEGSGTPSPEPGSPATSASGASSSAITTLTQIGSDGVITNGLSSKIDEVLGKTGGMTTVTYSERLDDDGRQSDCKFSFLDEFGDIKKASDINAFYIVSSRTHACGTCLSLRQFDLDKKDVTSRALIGLVVEKGDNDVELPMSLKWTTDHKYGISHPLHSRKEFFVQEVDKALCNLKPPENPLKKIFGLFRRELD